MFKECAVLFLVFAVLVSGCVKEETKIKTKVYFDPEGRFSMKIPENWTEQNIEFFDASFGQINEAEKKINLIGVNVQEAQGLTLDQALETVKTALESNNDLVELSKGSIKSKTQGMYIDFTTMFSGIDVKGRLGVFANQKSVFSVLYLANPNEYDKNLNEAEFSLNSFIVEGL